MPELRPLPGRDRACRRPAPAGAGRRRRCGAAPDRGPAALQPLRRARARRYERVDALRRLDMTPPGAERVRARQGGPRPDPFRPAPLLTSARPSRIVSAMTALLTNLRLWDGLADTALQNAAVLLDGERIAWAGPASDAPAPAASADVVDCRGGTLLPGLIDAHMHFGLGPP